MMHSAVEAASPFSCNKSGPAAYNFMQTQFDRVMAMPEGNYNIFDRIDGRIAKKKLEKVLEMLRTESPQEIRKKLGNIDRNEIMNKMNEYDTNKLKSMGININELKGTITEKDLEKLIQVLGPDGAVIAQRIKQILK